MCSVNKDVYRNFFMPIDMHILDTNRKLVAHHDLLRQLVPPAASKAAKLLDAQGIDISISPFKPGDAPSSGIGGYTISPYRVELLLDCKRQDLPEVMQRELPAVLGHEIHHCVRELNSPNPVTLGECITTEGLATHFELHMNGGLTPSLLHGLSDVDWRKLLEVARPNLDEKAFSFEDWFPGNDPEHLPGYTGYLIGFMAVSHYLKEKKLTDADIVDLTADELFQCR
jgi:hypothetical protein